MDLTLSTHTIHNVVLETGVTLSGRVVGPDGQPVPWLGIWPGDVSFGYTDASGHYSLGVPAGIYRIHVEESDSFLGQTLEGVEVTRDTVLNITLEAGVVLEGKVVDGEGQPVPDAQVCAHLSTEQWWEGFCGESESGGSFQIRVLPAAYVVHDPSGVPLPADPTAAGGQQGGSDGPRADGESGPHTVCPR